MISFAQNREHTSTEEITLPPNFFDTMFRSPSQEYLVAWYGGVKIAMVPFPESTYDDSGYDHLYELQGIK